MTKVGRLPNLFVLLDGDELLAVKNFFCEFLGNLPRVVDHILSGRSYGNEYALVCFPTELDEDEEPYEGVKIGMFEDLYTIIDEQTFREVLVEACRRFIHMYPTKQGEIETVLAKHGLTLSSYPWTRPPCA